jgi:hypothetical protein
MWWQASRLHFQKLVQPGTAAATEEFQLKVRSGFSP